MYDCEQYEGIPPGSVITASVTITEFLDADDLQSTVVTHAVDEAGEPLDLGKILYLLEWMRAIALAPLNAHCTAMAMEECDCEEDGDEY